ncbi:pyridoxamine 5'-phosphate oxidase family protein [Nonomuraea rubra]|uniref:pyridoxamine 5'-phosphate oxidase family protein n=1 Tax=Nonomuraea rubra TaxID=46180 RepID=UPI0031EF0FDF
MLSTVRRSGHPALSTVLYRWDPAARIIRISTTADRLKARQVRNNPHVALHVQGPDVWSFAVAEGEAEVSGDAAELLAFAGEQPDTAAFLEQQSQGTPRGDQDQGVPAVRHRPGPPVSRPPPGSGLRRRDQRAPACVAGRPDRPPGRAVAERAGGRPADAVIDVPSAQAEDRAAGETAARSGEQAARLPPAAGGPARDAGRGDADHEWRHAGRATQTTPLRPPAPPRCAVARRRRRRAAVINS